MQQHGEAASQGPGCAPGSTSSALPDMQLVAIAASTALQRLACSCRAVLAPADSDAWSPAAVTPILDLARCSHAWEVVQMLSDGFLYRGHHDHSHFGLFWMGARVEWKAVQC